MKHRELAELEVSAIGLGCMGMSAFYGASDEDEAIRTSQRPYARPAAGLAPAGARSS